jgi:hypothetical protein
MLNMNKIPMPHNGAQDAMLQKITAVDSLTTSTWYTERETLYSDIFQITPLYDMLQSKGKIKARAPKGLYFQIPFAYKKLKQNQKFFGRGAEFSREEGEFMTSLQFYVRNFGDSITRYWQDEVQNEGEAQILDYIEEVIKNHKASIQETLHESLWVQGDSLSINALPTLITTTPTTGSIGGIDRANNSYVRNVIDDMDSVSLAASLIDRMESFYNTLSQLKGGMARQTPDLIITTKTIYEKYVGIARALGQYQINPSQGGGNRVNLGMGEAMFKNAEMFWDPNCPEGQLYMLNTDTLEFPYDPNWWMQMTAWKDEPTTLERFAQVVTRCNLVCNNFNKNGVMFNMTTA